MKGYILLRVGDMEFHHGFCQIPVALCNGFWDPAMLINRGLLPS
jgi:hypothetical protein